MICRTKLIPEVSSISNNVHAQVLYVIFILNNTSTSTFGKKKKKKFLKRKKEKRKKENQHHQVDQVRQKGLRLPSPWWATQPIQK